MSSPMDIRTMTQADLALALDWAAQEGWNPGLHDAECFHAADPQGFLMGWIDGAPVASISVVRYGERFAFLGLYIVRPGFRGQGHGWALWQAGMKLAPGRSIGLDGVVAQQDNYRRSGFVLAGRNIRHEGRAGGSGGGADPDVLPLASVPWPQVEALDQAMFGTSRAAFLRAWLAQSGAVALGLRAADGTLAGYGVIRPCRQGHKIGPLFAPTPEAARRLFAALTSHAPAGSPVYLDTPQDNTGAVQLAAAAGMQPVFETARMYAGDAPALPLAQIYGITSFELG